MTLYLRCPAPGCGVSVPVTSPWTVPPQWVQARQDTWLSRPCCSTACLKTYLDARQRGLVLPKHFSSRHPSSPPLEPRVRGRHRRRRRAGDLPLTPPQPPPSGRPREA